MCTQKNISYSYIELHIILSCCFIPTNIMPCHLSAIQFIEFPYSRTCCSFWYPSSRDCSSFSLAFPLLINISSVVVLLSPNSASPSLLAWTLASEDEELDIELNRIELNWIELIFKLMMIRIKDDVDPFSTHVVTTGIYKEKIGVAMCFVKPLGFLKSTFYGFS